MYPDIEDNPYIDVAALEKLYKAFMKNQERQAIRSILAAKKQSNQKIGTGLKKTLDDEEDKMKNFASKDLTSDMQDGLEGQAANAASDYLKTTLQKPNLQSPVQNG